MTGNEAIEVLKNMLGEDDKEDEAIDFALYVLDQYIATYEGGTV